MNRPSLLRRAATLLAVAACACPSAPLLADRLHLEGGGSIDVADWWVEGDWIRYESQGGTIGVPRGMVVRIESLEPSEAAAPARTERPSVVAAGDARDEARHVEQVRRAAMAALDARDYETASDRFWDLIYLEPSSALPRIGYALAELKLERDGRALSAVQDGLVLHPDNAQLLELLGDLRSREDRVLDALSAWRRAFDATPSDALREKIFKAERELQARSHYAASATSHFNLRYDGKVDGNLASAIMDFLEDQYSALADEFDHQPPQPITVILYADREFRDVTRAPDWVGGLYDGKMRLPLAGLQRLDSRAQRVLRHELAHAVVHSKTRGHCPRWLQEGLAQRAEGKSLGREETRWVVEQLASHDPAEWTADRFSYAVALSLVEYLEAGGGFDDVVYLLELLGRGDDTDEALMRVFGDDRAGLLRRWRGHISARARR